MCVCVCVCVCVCLCIGVCMHTCVRPMQIGPHDKSNTHLHSTERLVESLRATVSEFKRTYITCYHARSALGALIP